MKLLFDENLSRRLLGQLAELYPKTAHVFEFGSPPKVIWLRRWVHPTKDADRVLRRQAIRISEFAADPELAVLVLDHE